MKIKLLRDSRIIHKAGEVVDAYPAEAEFLLSVQSAVKVEEEQHEEAKKQPRKGKK